MIFGQQATIDLQGEEEEGPGSDKPTTAGVPSREGGSDKGNVESYKVSQAPPKLC